MTLHVLVTGGAGFIGANLCRALLQRPDVARVSIIDDMSTGRLSNLDRVEVEFHEGSVLDRRLLNEAFTGVDAVIHLAAVSSVPGSMAEPVAVHHTNTTGTLEVLQAARRAGNVHVIAASSAAVYGDDHRLPKVEHMQPSPTSPYGASKVASEAYLTAFHRAYGLDVLPLRLFNVYGPLQRTAYAHAAVVPAFVTAALAGRPVTVSGDGTQTRDFTYVDTVTEVLCEAVIRRVVHATPVNLAFGSRISMLDIVDRLAKILNRPVPVEHTARRRGDIRHSQADATSVRRLFPTILPVAFTEGLARTVDWFRQQPDLDADNADLGSQTPALTTSSTQHVVDVTAYRAR